MKKICVFCSASGGIDKSYYESAEVLGKLMVENNFSLVYGGSSLGLMGHISKVIKENGGYSIGVMPEKLYNMLKHEGNCSEFHVSAGMRERKAKMDELSDGVIALAGGFGTLEEVSEMIVQKILGYNSKPIVFLNTNGFYDTLIKFFDEIIEKDFAQKSAKDVYYLAQTPEDAINYLKNYVPNYKEKTFDDIYVSAK